MPMSRHGLTKRSRDTFRKMGARDYMAREGADPDEFDSGMSDAELDAAFNVAPHGTRASEREHRIKGDALAQLDGLVEKHSLRVVLVALRVLADSRGDADCFNVPLTELADCEAWQRAADALEKVLESDKVRV